MVGASLHLGTREHMQMNMEYWESTIYNWCEEVVVNKKAQLPRRKNGKLKKFGYGDIIVSLYLERVPILWPQLIRVDEGGSRVPRLMRWFALMACHGGDGPVVRYMTKFSTWLSEQIVPIEEFPYAGMN